MVLVPIAAGFMGRKTEKKIWAAVILALAGLYFLCIKGSFRLEKGDIFLLCCAFGYTGQILAVDHYAQRVDSIELCCGQFLVGGILSLITAFFMEDVGGVHLGACIWPVVYLVVFSNCIAYTLQIVAQDGGNPTLVSLLFSMESVFAVLAGAVILKERLSGRELLGCGLIFAAVILAELPVRPVKRHRDGGRRIHDLY